MAARMRRLALLLLLLPAIAPTPAQAACPPLFDICVVDTDCTSWEDCVAGFCNGCGDAGEDWCDGTGGGEGDPNAFPVARCNVTQSVPCMTWHNWVDLPSPLGTRCDECGASGQNPCILDCAGQTVPAPLQGVCAPISNSGATIYGSTPGSLACQGGLTPSEATQTCVPCGGNGQPVCTNRLNPGIDDLCNPAYSPLALQPVSSGSEAYCYPCGGDGELECPHSAQPACDPGLAVFSLDEVRDVKVRPPLEAALPAWILDLIPASAIDSIDACWDPQTVDFAIDPPEAWPAQESLQGARTWIQVHGRNGGGFTESFNPGALGTRNWLRYRLDYNAHGVQPLPFRLWAWDDQGNPYVAYQSAEIVSPSNYVWTLRDVSDFLYDALRKVPLKGELILQGHSQGGFVIKDFMRRHYDEMRFRGHPVAQMIFTSHPHVGIVLDPYRYTPFLCSGLAEGNIESPTFEDIRNIYQNCQSGRWMTAWNDSLAPIDERDYPQIKWGSATGDCGSGGPGAGCGCDPVPPECSCSGGDPPYCAELCSCTGIPPGDEVQVPGECAELFVPPGFDFGALDGDGLFNADSGLGIDTYDNFWFDQLQFDAIALGDCLHVTECGIGALSALDPDLYTDQAVCGDLTGDGDITQPDMDLLRDGLADLTTLSAAELDYCSVSAGDTTCDIADVALLARALDPMAPPLSQSCAGAIDLRRGLVLYWPFDEIQAGLTFNESPSGPLFDGQITGTPTLALDGVGGGSFDFDGGADSVRVTAARPLRALENDAVLTMAAWVYPSGGPVDGIILNKEGEYEFALFADEQLKWAIADDAGFWTWISTGVFAPQLQWTHVAVVFDAHAGEVRSYENGSLAHVHPWTGGWSGDALPALNELWAGNRQSGAAMPFSGRLDEVSVWARALSDHEIALLYNGGAGQSLAAPLDPHRLGVVLWLDADDAATITTGGGGVSQWNDKSGSGLDVSAAPGAEPALAAGALNGRDTLAFTPGDHLCASGALDLTQGATLAFVSRNDVRKNYNGIFSLRSDVLTHADLEVYWQAGSDGSGNLVYASNRAAGGGSFFIASDAGPPAGSFYQATLVVDSDTTAGRIYLGGALETNDSVADNNSFFPDTVLSPCVGLGFGDTGDPSLMLDGDLAELLVFDRALGDGERIRVEDYLREKWGLP